MKAPKCGDCGYPLLPGEDRCPCADAELMFEREFADIHDALYDLHVEAADKASRKTMTAYPDARERLLSYLWSEAASSWAKARNTLLGPKLARYPGLTWHAALSECSDAMAFEAMTLELDKHLPKGFDHNH